MPQRAEAELSAKRTACPCKTCREESGRQWPPFLAAREGSDSRGARSAALRYAALLVELEQLSA